MNVPKIRFKNYEKEWKKTTLKNVAIINPKNEQIPNEFIYIDLESVNKGILSQEKIISKSSAPSRAQRTIKKNDILFQTVRPYQQNNYFVKETKELPYIASTGYALIRTSEDPYFIYSILHKKDFLDKVIDRCTGTSFPAISANDLGDININIPDIKEQMKVSNFLSLLDKKIELQTKKIEDLKLFKICTLDRYFNKNINETRSLLKNYCFCLTGKSKIDKVDMKGKYYIMDMGTVNADGNILKIKPTFCNSDLLSYGDLVMPKDDIGGGLIIGKTGFIDEDNKYILGDHVYLLKTKNINSLFLHYQINSRYINRQLKRKVTGSAQLGLKSDNILNQEIFVYSDNTQEKIANIFKLMDKKIELECNELNKLLEYKKGLMQNMFV